MSRQKIVWGDKEYASVEYMAIIHCTQKEIAGVMGVDEDTLNRLLKVRYGTKSFSEWYEKYSSQGKMSLRRAQFKAAEGGNVSMLIWLGKQYLGQREVVEQKVTTKSAIELIAQELMGENGETE